MSPTTDDDFALLDRWATGDREAGSALVKRHIDTLRGHLYKKIGDGAEDLAQRTLLVCLEKRNGFRRESSFRTYLFAVADNLVLAEHRSRKRRGRHEELDPAIHASKLGGRSPTGVIAAKEARRQLLEGVRQLPETWQQIFRLYFLEKQTAPQIAAALKMNLGTVRSRIDRSKAKLREYIEQIPAERLRAATSTEFEDWEKSLEDKA